MLTLCLNLINTFQVPLEKYFPEYTGGTDINKAAKYILWRFMQANRARLTVYPQYVSSYTILRPATDSHLSMAQFDPSHRHKEHSTRLCRGKGDNTPECPQRFGDPIARPVPSVVSLSSGELYPSAVKARLLSTPTTFQVSVLMSSLVFSTLSRSWHFPCEDRRPMLISISILLLSYHSFYLVTMTTDPSLTDLMVVHLVPPSSVAISPSVLLGSFERSAEWVIPEVIPYIHPQLG